MIEPIFADTVTAVNSSLGIVVSFVGATPAFLITSEQWTEESPTSLT